MASKPIRLAIIGMGGFARQHQRAALALEEQGLCELVATCDPQPDAFAADREAWRYEQREVAVYSDYLQMLDACGGSLDMVTVPTPVPLHAAMHRECVDRQIACYLEKPPTLFPPEMAEMMAVEARAKKATQVGFNFIVEMPRRMLKARILEGEFGALRRVAFAGVWPRSTDYYARAAWAGSLVLDGRPVLDSPLGNAMAHYVHNALFWCGPEDVLDWGRVVETEAELYRAHSIGSFDTGFVRGRTAVGVELLLAATHACEGPQHQREVIVCDRAVITYITGEGYRVEWKGGRPETGAADKRDLLRENFRSYFGYLHGETDRPLTGLADSQPFVDLYAQTFVAAGAIHRVTGDSVEVTPTDRGNFLEIRGIRQAVDGFVDGGAFPSEQNLPWGRPGGKATPERIAELSRTVEEMAGQR